MHKPFRLTFALLLAVVACQLSPAPTAAQEDPEARKAKILANLKLAFPQLDQMNISMGEIAASDFAGLDSGSFTIGNGGRTQNQSFFVTQDDTQLYLLSGEAIDVSRSAEDIQTEIARREEEAARAAADRLQELEESVAGLPTRGNPEAPVLIVEFSDFQCPYCSRGANTVEQILERYGEDVRFVFKHFPLDFHPWAKPASIATHCAGQQDHDAFWSLHDGYFKDQKQITPANVLAKSKEYLADSGIDMAAWATCAEDESSEEYKAAAAVVDADMAFGQKLGVSGTPGFFVNGEFLNGAQPLSAFEPLIAKAKSAS
jgi:protein-disulfide isomerase